LRKLASIRPQNQRLKKQLALSHEGTCERPGTGYTDESTEVSKARGLPQSLHQDLSLEHKTKEKRHEDER